jgi:hypothetical protein
MGLRGYTSYIWLDIRRTRVANIQKLSEMKEDYMYMLTLKCFKLVLDLAYAPRRSGSKVNKPKRDDEPLLKEIY